MTQKTLFMLLFATTSMMAPAFGQGVSAVITPNPAPLGQPITITITEANGFGIQLPTSCVIRQIHSGGPAGPVVFAPFCLQVITPVGPWGTRSQTWNQTDNNGAQVPAGRYWIEVRYFDQSFNPDSDFFCVDVVNPGAMPPVLVPATVAQVGQPFVLNLSAPAFANGVYVAAASLTTDAGQTIGPFDLCLDNDVLFDLSFPAPNPLLFVNFQGGLDGAGNASGLTVLIPNVPVLQCRGIHVQAATVNLGPVFLAGLSNDVSATIAP